MGLGWRKAGGPPRSPPSTARVILTAAPAGSPAPQPPKEATSAPAPQGLGCPSPRHWIRHKVDDWRHSSSHAVSLSSQKSVETLRLVLSPCFQHPSFSRAHWRKFSSTDTHSPPRWMFFRDLVLIPKARKQLSPWATSTEPTCCKSRSPSTLEPRDLQQEKPRHWEARE